MQYKIYVVTNPNNKKSVCEGKISLSDYGRALAMDKSGKEVIGQLLRANVESINEDGILISGFEEIINNPFEQPKYSYQEWLLKCSQENEAYEIYVQEPEPKQICLGTCKFNKDSQAFAIDKNNLVIAELTRARISFISADGIMVSGFEEVGQDKTGKPKFRYQELWLRYADAVDPHAHEDS
jgi:hypothetical protein